MRGALNLLHGKRTSFIFAYKNADLDYKLPKNHELVNPDARLTAGSLYQYFTYCVI